MYVLYFLDMANKKKQKCKLDFLFDEYKCSLYELSSHSVTMVFKSTGNTCRSRLVAQFMRF